MVIPVYKNYFKQASNACYYVTELDKTQENQGISDNTNDIECLCNLKTVENNGISEKGNIVTQVTSEKSKKYWLDKFEERATIYEYEANMGRIKAEAQAQAIDDLAVEWMKVHKSEDGERTIKELFSYGIKNPYYKW